VLVEGSTNAVAFGFVVGTDDSYSINNSAGYRYEETKCREIKHNLNETLFDSYDWSYDATDQYQGKNHK